MLQMLSHGLIASVLFFLTGVTYDRTHTLFMDRMNGIAQMMPKTFALFTAGAMASLALPGMSGFAGEIAVFIGISSSDIYSSSFRVVLVLLAAVGLILTPIYLLSMLRMVFYKSDEAITCDINGSEIKSFSNDEPVCFGNSCVLPGEAIFEDVNPREIFIAASFLVLIIGMGVYPKLVTQTYDVKTTELAAHSYQQALAHKSEETNLYASHKNQIAPPIPQPETLGLISIQ